MITKHWLTLARRVPSPNFDERPGGESDLSLVVIHGISLPPNAFGGPYVDQLFTNTLDSKKHPFFESIKELRVSAHLFIQRNGELSQYVPFNRRAWHSGVSSYQGRSHCNDYSIGIELEGTDEAPYESSQYESLKKVLKILVKKYSSLSFDRIVRHSDIAPGRKTDPGPYFDWDKVKLTI